jgi:hypothetical protein
MTLRFGPYDYRRTRYRTCADGEGRLGTAEAPLIASSTVPSDGQIALTAVGMISAPAVRRVRVTHCDGRVTTVALRKMSSPQARAAGMRRLRYAALVVRGAWCAERLLSIGAQGQSLWDSGP